MSERPFWQIIDQREQGQINKPKLLTLLLLIPFFLVGCGSPYNPTVEAEEAMPQLMDENNFDESN